MPSQEASSSFAHRAVVKLRCNLPCVICIQRQRCPPVHNLVRIMARQCRKARIKIRRDRLAAQNRNGCWAQVIIERAKNGGGRKVPNKVEVRNLAFRVNSGVCPARTSKIDFLAAEAPDGPDQFALHRGAIRLLLPANEGRPIIFDYDFVTGHGCLMEGAPPPLHAGFTLPIGTSFYGKAKPGQPPGIAIRALL